MGIQLKKRALVFAGAGASYAVSPDAYPTTVQFFEKLPKAIRDHALIKALIDKLPEKFGEGSPDVEKILWTIDELERYLGAINDPKHPASWLLPNNSLPGCVGSQHPVSQYVKCARDALRVALQLRNDISAHVYKFYSNLPGESLLADNWIKLLKMLSESGFWLDVITTNYDLIIECAANFSEVELNYGDGRGPVRALDQDLWKSSLADPSFRPPGGGMLTKLHGSVNWMRQAGEIVFGGTQYLGNHSYHGVIYPGFKGVPKDEPFSLMHSYFEAAMQRSDVIVFVGFAFRDEYINTCIDRSVGSKAVYVIDPGDVVVPLSFKDNVHHIRMGFDASSVIELSRLIASAHTAESSMAGA